MNKMSFYKGVWLAVEYLVRVDQPTMADEIIESAGITRKIAEKILQETEYLREELTSQLEIFKESTK